MENIYVDIIFTYLLEIFAKVKLKYDSAHIHFSIPYRNKYFVCSEFDS